MGATRIPGRRPATSLAPDADRPDLPADMALGIVFTRHLAELVEALGGADIGAQKLHLRAMVIAAKDGVVRLRVTPAAIATKDGAVSPLLPGVPALQARMLALGGAGLEVTPEGPPSALLTLARVLADVNRPVDEAQEVLDTLPDGVRWIPASALAAVPAPPPPPVVAAAAERTAEPAAPAAPVAPVAPVAPAEPAEPPAPIQSPIAALFGPVSARAELPGLLAALREPEAPSQVARLLDEVCTAIEVAQREARLDDMRTAFHALVAAEARPEHASAAETFDLAIRRAARPLVLDGLVRLAIAIVPPPDDVVRVLARTKEEGVLAVVERDLLAPTTEERDRLASLLGLLPAAGPGLGHIAATARQLAARQAARLAEQLHLRDAEAGLARAAAGSSPDVRREALMALAAIGGPGAIAAHVRGLRDEDPEVRLQATAGLVVLRPEDVVDTLATALAEEAQPEVQAALVQAIGRTGLPSALAPLTQAAEPARGLFRRKSATLRIAAVVALAQVRVPGVASVLQGLSQDRDRGVRDALAQATRVHGRRTTRAMAAIAER